LEKFNEVGKAKFIVGQNLGFDLNIMGCEFHRLGVESQMSKMPVLDLYRSYRFLIKITRWSWRTFKLPTELHSFLLIKHLEAHNATDVEATTRCFLELIRRELYQEQLV
jgi:DNA polymerase-3 subunit alpha